MDAVGRGGKRVQALVADPATTPATDPVMAGPSHLRQAQMHERLGEPEQAVIQYRRFIELWSDCDPEFRPMLEGAQRALERLTTEPTTD